MSCLNFFSKKRPLLWVSRTRGACGGNVALLVSPPPKHALCRCAVQNFFFASYFAVSLIKNVFFPCAAQPNKVSLPETFFSLFPSFKGWKRPFLFLAFGGIPPCAPRPKCRSKKTIKKIVENLDELGRAHLYESPLFRRPFEDLKKLRNRNC